MKNAEHNIKITADGKDLQQWVADFGDPRAPVALTDAAVALLRPSHGGFRRGEKLGLQ